MQQLIHTIIREDSRYNEEAYRFILEALDYTCRLVKKKRHVSGGELLAGVRLCALEKFGPMAREVLQHWGVRNCEDIGELVFTMVEHNILSKTDKDSREDFREGYDFSEAFDRVFEPNCGKEVRNNE